MHLRNTQIKPKGNQLLWFFTFHHLIFHKRLLIFSSHFKTPNLSTLSKTTHIFKNPHFGEGPKSTLWIKIKNDEINKLSHPKIYIINFQNVDFFKMSKLCLVIKNKKMTVENLGD